MSNKPIIFSGMQPSSNSLHMGNYIGALLNWVNMQDSFETYYCVVNMHAITVPQNPEELKERSRATVAQYIAGGINPEKSTLFIQSQVSAHAELAWVLNTITGFGEASRMTQFKDKSQKQGSDLSSVGLFTYPMLMASDILLYKTDTVPVGEDQRQHVELTRNLAERFNSRFGKVFTIPNASIQKETAKIYDLQNPVAKMSKSAESDSGLLSILDDPKILSKKIMRSVTDADNQVLFDRENKPGISNLLTIFAVLSSRSIESLESEYQNGGYGSFKKDLAELVVNHFTPIREKYFELMNDRSELDRILKQGANRANEKAQTTLAEVYSAIGLE